MAEGDPSRQMLRAFLAEQDVSCPQCHYNLRALEGDVCPECGDQIRLSVQLVEPKQAAMLTGLIGLSAGAGFNGLLLIYVVIQIVIFHRGGPGGPGIYNKFVVINGVGFIAVGGLLLLWLWKWRWIRSLAARIRWTMAVGCWILSLIDLIIFSAAIR